MENARPYIITVRQPGEGLRGCRPSFYLLYSLLCCVQIDDDDDDDAELNQQQHQHSLHLMHIYH